MKKFFISILLTGLCMFSKPISSQNISNNTVTQEVTNYLNILFSQFLNNNPEFASMIGSKVNYGSWAKRNDAKYLQDIEVILSGAKYLKNKYPLAVLDDVTKLNIQLFEEEGKRLKEAFQWRHYNYIFSQLQGDHVDLPNFLINVHMIDNDDDARNYISRLKGIAGVFEEDIAALNIQKQYNIEPPKFTFEYVIKDIEKIIRGLDQKNDDNILYQDFDTKLKKIKLRDDIRQTLLDTAFGVLSTEVKQAYENLLKNIVAQSNLAKDNNGVWALPNGDEYYKYSLQYATTTSFTPEEIYQTGLKEVERLHNEIKGVMKKMKFNKSLPLFFEYLKTSPKFKYPNNDSGRQLLLSRSEKYMENISILLPQYFNTLPKAKCVVMPVEKFREASAAGAFYEQPSEDGSRPGRFYVNMLTMESEKTYELEALVYHEALPGHHMQIAIAQELKDVPRFRKYSFNNAYVEGWALYSELLGKEMNLYKNIESEIGRLSMELFRAARLVVDVGIHNKKWSKEQATEYMLKNTLNSELDCKREIERYFLWPGQATSYKVGMLQIIKLRKDAQARLGKKFDIKAFHDVILKNGSVPMNVLETLINEWIETVLVQAKT